jgi:hypothetical protein
MFEKAATLLLDNGLMGVAIVLLILAVIRLFNLLQASQSEKEQYLREDRKAMLDVISEGAESADRLSRWIKATDRQ